jgi:hypothetical protein
MNSRVNERAARLKPVLEQLGFGEACPKGIYLVVPVTSGILLWDLAKKHGFADLDRVRKDFPAEYEFQVLRQNRNAAEHLASFAAKRFPGEVVVNPWTVEVPGWSQAQYRRAWKGFILRFAKTLVVASGWQYSHGCVEEVTHALKHRIRIVNDSDCKLSFRDAYKAIDAARIFAIKNKLRAPFLGKFLAKLGGNNSLLKGVAIHPSGNKSSRRNRRRLSP